MKRSIPLVALLVAVLMIRPTTLYAHQIQTGLGYVGGDCTIQDGDHSRKCFQGARAEASWFLAQSEGFDRSAFSTSNGTRSSSESLVRASDFRAGSSHPGAFVAVLLAVVLVLGVIWALVYLFSSKAKFGFYLAHDSTVAGFASPGVARYDAQRLGVKAVFYPVESSSFEVHAAVGALWAQSKGELDSNSDRRADLNGWSSKMGLGFSPQLDESGFLALAEFEGQFFSKGSLGRYVRETNENPLPNARSNWGFLFGHAWAL